MILIFDILVAFALGILLYNRDWIHSRLSIILTCFLYIIIKAILLGIVLGFFGMYFRENILQISAIINLVVGFGLLFFWRYLHLKNVSKKYKINAITIVSSLFLGVSAFFIYNIIPYGGDELMYHLPISVELLNKGSWMKDLGLSYYWHNDIRQWYPKNLYFIIDYFFTIGGKNILGIQFFPIFAFFFFYFSVLKITVFFLEKNEVQSRNIALMSALIALSVPVTYLHFFVKVDILMFGMILLFIYNLLIFGNIYFLIVLALIIIGLKIIGVFFIGVIGISFLIYAFFYEKEHLFGYVKNLFQKKWMVLTFSIFTGIIFLYSFIYNQIAHGNFLYPINIIKLDNATLQENMSVFYGIKYYLRDYIFSDYYNYFLKSGILTYENSGLYNYDRGLGVMGFLMIVGVCLYFIFVKEKSHKINNFIFILITIFLLLSISKLNVIFGHRYQIFIYVLLSFLLSYSIYTIFKKDYKYIIFGIFLANVALCIPFVGGFGEKGSGINQLYHPTRTNYCNKINYIGDIARDDYRNGWKYVCENIENKNILAINQVFNFYLYGKYFNNTVYNKIFFNKKEFFDFLKNNKIDYIITSNKNNLYGNFGIHNTKFYANSTDYNDESTLFCKNVDYKEVKSIQLSYQLEGEPNVLFNFGTNDFEENIVLKKTKAQLDLKNSHVQNICINIFDLPKTSLNNKTKFVKFSKIEFIKTDGTKVKIDTKGFKFKDSAIEDVWMFKNGYKKIYTTDSNEIDYFYLWKK